MIDFYTRRRERFLNEKPYTAFVSGTADLVASAEQLLKEELSTQPPDGPAYEQWNADVMASKTEMLIGRYSAGDSIGEIAAGFPEVLGALEAGALPHPRYRTGPFYLDEPDTYAYAMWLLSLAKLLRQDHLVPRVAALFDVARPDNRGQDALFESLLDKLGLPREPATRCLKNMKAHPLLLEAIQAELAQRPKRVAQFLDKWYPSMKACYWHGRHTRVPQNFFGYWAFEAGLVTYLWDIDDSSYRDMPFYPRDLVDYARSHPAATPSNPTTDAGGARCRPGVHAGQACPETGFWFTPAKANSRRHFSAGEVMPDVGGDYGATIWQWDTRQAQPRT